MDLVVTTASAVSVTQRGTILALWGLVGLAGGAAYIFKGTAVRKRRRRPKSTLSTMPSNGEVQLAPERKKERKKPVQQRAATLPPPSLPEAPSPADKVKVEVEEEKFNKLFKEDSVADPELDDFERFKALNLQQAGLTTPPDFKEREPDPTRLRFNTPRGTADISFAENFNRHYQSVSSVSSN